ncbi:MAG: hypothetical protein ACM31L_06860 [Actinomycetota bacterium]
MTEHDNRTNLDRRAFLRGLTMSAGAATAAAVAVGSGKADAAAAQQVRADAGYQETDHVREAYRASAF